MNTNTSLDQPGKEPTHPILRWLLQVGVFTLILAASLFISSGRLYWTMGWIYVGVFVASQGITALVVISDNPELAAERTQREAAPIARWDRALAGIVSLFGPASMWIVAGLDVRFGWSSQVSLALQIAALAIVVSGSLLTIWAMASNKFFYAHVRVEKKRGHTVATGGPYQLVRHPGYLGAVLFDLATPPMLNSCWAFIPAMLTVCAIVVRTALEDKTLHAKLDGYGDYARRVRYRLLPGIW
jgi:protein-S-isoprenylcysteine O-methyltransferase Ste14